MFKMASTSLLIINPNSTQSVTEGLKEALGPITPPGTTLTFYTAPSNAPPSINDATTGVLTAAACIEDIEAKGLINQFDGFLVCCFSDHPLVHILREKTAKPAIGILEAAIVQALLIGKRFGIVTTGTGYKYIHYTEVRNFLGATSERFAGLIATGLGVVELREGDREHVKKKVKEGSAKIVAAGADVILLGCAAMAGMEELVQQGVVEAGFEPVRIVDGAKAGVEIIAGLARLSRSYI
ncbi:Asp/Glu/hydantoin racemase [Crucibulum laeve]|uniref:Asp/Glu/hydantoin racemase n=1 Tax=Crucibulum laeve TaxID=68775 RepID=A0A5C3M5S0_9AGAR|nr:Asp/Glu/hydantoin racemase [Crucibulum laeve]